MWTYLTTFPDEVEIIDALRPTMKTTNVAIRKLLGAREKWNTDDSAMREQLAQELAQRPNEPSERTRKTQAELRGRRVTLLASEVELRSGAIAEYLAAREGIMRHALEISEHLAASASRLVRENLRKTGFTETGPALDRLVRGHDEVRKHADAINTLRAKLADGSWRIANTNALTQIKAELAMLRGDNRRVAPSGRVAVPMCGGR